MKNIKDMNEIGRLTREKQALEVGLAMDMLEIFNDEKAGLITKIRELVSAAVDEINDQWAMTTSFDRKWFGDWNQYAGCKDHHISLWDYDSIKGKVGSFRAEHCADWIRIFGEVVEELTRGSQEKKRTGYQKGDKYHWTKYDGKAGGGQPGAGRRRILDKFNENKERYASRQTPSWEFLKGLPSAGISRWNIMDNDTTGKMDQVFGLTPGATISGTTTDNIYFIDKFSRLKIDPIYYLLPTATLVSGGHHTLLEVALPLSLNKIINYEIGLYSTMFPNRKGFFGGGSCSREIELLLGNYENHAWNHLMLMYYDRPRQCGGCYLFDKIEDKKTWQEFAVADDQLMRRFKALPAWPKKKHVQGLPFI